jgi:GTP cyclohydrolase I
MPANCREDRELNIQIRDFPQQSGATSSREEAEAAFRTIIRWAGDNPDRPGLLETPSRAARAFREYFAAYDQHPLLIPNKTFDETRGYEEMVVLRGISFQSYCDHHCAHYRSGVGCLRSLWAGCGALEVCSRCRRICRAAPDPGANDFGDSFRSSGSLATPRRWRGDQGDSSLPIEPGRSKGWSGNGDKLHARLLSRQRPTRQEFLAMTKQ